MFRTRHILLWTKESTSKAFSHQKIDHKVSTLSCNTKRQANFCLFFISTEFCGWPGSGPHHLGRPRCSLYKHPSRSHNHSRTCSNNDLHSCRHFCPLAMPKSRKIHDINVSWGNGRYTQMVDFGRNSSLHFKDPTLSLSDTNASDIIHTIVQHVFHSFSNPRSRLIPWNTAS